jgi:uncharacterized protein YqgQ
MKTKRLLFIIIVSIISAFSIYAQVRIDNKHFTNLFNDGKYVQLFNEAYTIRTSEEYGKNWIVDFYMSIALCGKGKTTIAEEGFSYIEHEYALNLKQKELIEDGRQFCISRIPVSGSSSDKMGLAYLVLNNQNAASYPVSIVSGKLGQILDCGANVEEYKFNPSFDQAELQERLFEINENNRALNYYRSHLPTNKYNINSFGHFIIVTRAPADLNSHDIEMAAQELERIYKYLVNQYNLRPPNYLITIYLMGDLESLQKVALITHGLKIPSNSYGYSCIADLSVLGNSSKVRFGTIKHELFHLVIRTDLGDIPGWLDEGTACLYEESHWEGDSLKYNKNLWRTTVLKHNDEARKPLPLIKTLINNNWNEFTPNNNSTICELSVNYALAKHFAMYLEDKDELKRVIAAFKNRKNIFVDTTSSNINQITILEEALQQKLPDIQKDFDDWLFKKFKISTYRDKSSVLDRMSRFEYIDYICDKNPEVEYFKQEYMELYNELRNSGPVISDDLLERCIKILARAEKMYLDCSHEFPTINH